MSGNMDQTTMRDPFTQYPRPDFEKQPQPAPGLAREMRPKPDHGETRYRGMGRLKGRHTLITGADSGIGRAVASAFAREGADLALNYLHSHGGKPATHTPTQHQPSHPRRRPHGAARFQVDRS
jgi:hypothetical protein